MMNNLVELGSQTAKNGFKNEQDICDKFMHWKQDVEESPFRKRAKTMAGTPQICYSLSLIQPNYLNEDYSVPSSFTTLVARITLSKARKSASLI